MWERWIIYTQFQPENLKERGVVEFEGIDGWTTLTYGDSTLCVEVYLAQDCASRESSGYNDDDDDDDYNNTEVVGLHIHVRWGGGGN